MTSLNRDCIGRTYTGSDVEVIGDHVVDFALASNDPNPWYVNADRPGGTVAPPVFSVRLIREVMALVLGDPELRCDVLRLVHGEQESTVHRFLRPGDVVSITAAITGIEDKHSGQVLRVQHTLSVAGEVAVVGKAAAFIRGSGSLPPKGPDAAKKAPFGPPESGPTHVDVMAVSEDQAQRYAKASLDFNPIHLDAGVAKAAGLPAVILQGTCTMAFAARAIIQHVLAGDPSRLKSIGVRFSRSVYLPDQVTTEIWPSGPGVWHFRAKNQAGDIVITNGRAEVR